MYVLIVYDISVERVTKVHKCLKRFLQQFNFLPDRTKPV